MDEWIKIGPRYINVRNICEVRLDEHLRDAHIFYVGGAMTELRDEEAVDLRDELMRRATIVEGTHRTVFIPSSS
jgi:hypothetical protein